MSPLLLFAIFSLLSITRAQYQSRSSHGLIHQNPMTLSPSAFEFFHPDNLQPSTESPCAASGCRPLLIAAFEFFHPDNLQPSTESPSAASGCRPLLIAATVQSSLGYESRSTRDRGGSRMEAGGIVGTFFGFVFVALLAVGVYYIMTRRRTNMSRSNSVQCEA